MDIKVSIKLLTDDKYKDLSIEAKLLYCLLKQKQKASITNSFLLVDRQELASIFCKSISTVSRYLKELKKYQLIEISRSYIQILHII